MNDEKGLLLKCEAPQLNSDPDTDIFNSCTLAPGRTLDDVMHTFIRAIHFVQNEQLKEWAEWTKEQKEKPARNPTRSSQAAERAAENSPEQRAKIPLIPDALRHN